MNKTRKELIGRFLKYVSYNTQSCEESDSCPSTEGQTAFARVLEAELKEIGMEDVDLDEHCCLYATLSANATNAPAVGFIAHIDTSPDCSGENVRPRLIERYDGQDILLNQADSIVSSPKQFPELLAHIGEDLIVTDGHTLLGADDKAGIAEIVQAMAYLKRNPQIKHGKIRVAFTPDEEIGRGALHFNVQKFGCRWAYTIDGGEAGELEYENFNAAAAKVTVTGLNVHPGYAKNKMRNSMLIAAEFIRRLPPQETPEHTDGYEGFFHLTSIQGSVERTTLSYLVRDHDRAKFKARKNFLLQIANEMNNAYGPIVRVELKDQYYNMREKLEPMMHIVRIAKQAIEATGLTCKIVPVRGGTDGAQLSFKGLPCPNIFAGGLNMHSRNEFISVQSMEKAMMTIVNIARIAANETTSA